MQTTNNNHKNEEFNFILDRIIKEEIQVDAIKFHILYTDILNSEYNFKNGQEFLDTLYINSGARAVDEMIYFTRAQCVKLNYLI